MSTENNKPAVSRIAVAWTAIKNFMTYREIERSGCYKTDPTPRWFLPY